MQSPLVLLESVESVTALLELMELIPHFHQLHQQAAAAAGRLILVLQKLVGRGLAVKVIHHPTSQRVQPVQPIKVLLVAMDKQQEPAVLFTQVVVVDQVPLDLIKHLGRQVQEATVAMVSRP